MVDPRASLYIDAISRQTTDLQMWRVQEDALRRGELFNSNLIIFPPFPPALAAAIKAKDGPGYPKVLADFAGEPFFMSYGSLQVPGLLFTRQRKIDNYRTERNKLVAELREELARTKDKSGTVQLEAIAHLAQAQEKRIAALEKKAEVIRVDLTTEVEGPIPGIYESMMRGSRPTSSPVNGYGYFDAGAALANARDAIKPDEQPGMKNYLTALLVAEFQPGLSLYQRLLLHEIAADSLVKAQFAPGSVGEELHYFLPGSARIRWPQTTNPDFARKIELFGEKRSVLKRELAESVMSVPGERPTPKHARKYADLAKAQAPRFAELETLAEEIRVALVGLPYPDQPAPSSLPADLINHVGHMMDAKNSLLREIRRKGDELGRELAPERVEVVYQNNTASLAALPAADPTAALKKNRKQILGRLQAANGEYKKRFADLASEMNAVRAEIQKYHDSLPGEKVPDVNALSIQLARAYTTQENWNRYRDYRDAALTPGLSPAQRRLLFAAAVVDLEKYRLSLAN
jgi:hypothetical protein